MTFALSSFAFAARLSGLFVNSVQARRTFGRLTRIRRRRFFLQARFIVLVVNLLAFVMRQPYHLHLHYAEGCRVLCLWACILSTLTRGCYLR